VLLEAKKRVLESAGGKQGEVDRAQRIVQTAFAEGWEFDSDDEFFVAYAQNVVYAVFELWQAGTDENGQLHARENVIHELGLFQGRLGFSRAIVLLEEKTTEFSNISGIHQIRFRKRGIRETFGDVLATIRREFGGL
jgi:hypothetical protein